MHSRSSTSESSELQDVVAPHAIDLRRCSAAGTKWLDNNADGVRDAGDDGLAGFRIYADLNGDGNFDNGEPFAISDDNGDYVIDDIKPSGRYTLREEPTNAVPLDEPWTCSHPAPSCTWTVDAAAQPYAKHRDFGNWRPARITLTKKLDPPDDSGRFDLSFGSSTLHNAGDGDTETFSVKPGSYPVSETPVAGTDAADYDSSVSCHPVSKLVRLLRGATSTTQTVTAGQQIECTFVNVRHGSPSVTIDKIAPAFALHGATLKYQLAVTNTGSVSFAAGDVDVKDAQCDNPPNLGQQLNGKGEADASPGSLDPGDTWLYACQRTTKPIDDPDTCRETKATNTGRVHVPGASDEDDEVTILICPPPRHLGVSIVKVGPGVSVAGTPLTYILYVSNTGEVSFAESNVTVSDPACDAPPALVARYDASGDPDSSPDRLDPDDVWVYSCVNATPAPGPNCQPSTVTNTSTVVATSGRRTVDDSDTFDTPLVCPPAPPTPQPQPEPPGPVTPEGAVPSEAPSLPPPAAGVAGLSALSPIRGCLRRGSRVVIRGSRIASITVTVGGKRVGGLRVQALQRRAIIHVVGNLKPGRYRATATIRFQRGSDTPTVRLTRTVRVCAAAQPPRFTG